MHVNYFLFWCDVFLGLYDCDYDAAGLGWNCKRSVASKDFALKVRWISFCSFVEGEKKICETVQWTHQNNLKKKKTTSRNN